MASESRDPAQYATHEVRLNINIDQYCASGLFRWVPGLVPLRSTRPGRESVPLLRDRHRRRMPIHRHIIRLRRDALEPGPDRGESGQVEVAFVRDVRPR